jgi:hypothetical protein
MQIHEENIWETVFSVAAHKSAFAETYEFSILILNLCNVEGSISDNMVSNDNRTSPVYNNAKKVDSDKMSLPKFVLI